MAQADYAVTSGKVALASAATKTLWLLNPVTNNASIVQMDISMDGSVSGANPQVDLYIVTTLGSPAGTAGTVNKGRAGGIPAATTTALTALTAEPTAVTVVASWFVAPSGLYTLQLPLGREPEMAGGGARWGLRVVTASGVTPNCIANVWFEE